MTTTIAPMDDKDYYDIVKKAFVLYQSSEELSFFLWNKFGNDFIALDEMKLFRQKALHLDNATELPF